MNQKLLKNFNLTEIRWIQTYWHFQNGYALGRKMRRIYGRTEKNKCFECEWNLTELQSGKCQR